jgi:hypothetical protein
MRLDQLRFARVGEEHAAQLGARVDPEPGEPVVQVILDGPLAGEPRVQD